MALQRCLQNGGRNSKTSLHFDVLCSYSWSANLIGRKLWKVFLEDDLENAQNYLLVSEPYYLIFSTVLFQLRHQSHYFSH